MISNPTDDEKYMIFRALVRMIKTNSGDGFLNSDQGHPAYLLGAQGKVDAVMALSLTGVIAAPIFLVIQVGVVLGIQ